MNLISFANFNPSENQTSLLPAIEKDGKPEDFSAILTNIFVALQTANSPATNFSSGFEQNNLQVQTVSESGQNFVFGSNPDLAETPFVQTANQDLKTNLNQTFFPSNVDPEITQSANVNTETLNLSFQVDSAISFSPTEKLISIPTNFQPLPKLPTMPDLSPKTSSDSNLPRVSISQNPLPDLENIIKLSQIAPVDQEPLNLKTNENAKDFEIVPQSDDFFSKQKFSPIAEFSPNPINFEENIFPETANLPNTNILPVDDPVNVEASYIKYSEFKPTSETKFSEAKIEVVDKKTDFASNFSQSQNTSDSKAKFEYPNLIPTLNSVLEYPTKPKIDLPQNPIDPIPAEKDSVSNDFLIQPETKNSQPFIEDLSTKPILNESLPIINESLPAEQIEFTPNIKPETASDNNFSEIKPDDAKPELISNPNVNEYAVTETETSLKFKTEILAEAPSPKIETYQLTSETEIPAETPALEFTDSSISIEIQPEIEKPTVVNETPVEVKNYQIKPLDFVSQTGERIPANQSVQNVSPDEVSINESIDEVLVNESINDNSLKASLPAEKKAVSAATDTAFTLNTEIAEPVSTAAPENIVPQINPEKIITTDFAEKIELPERKTVSAKTTNNEAELSLNPKNQVQNNEPPKNQKQTQSQEVSANESAQTESKIKITETDSSSNSQELNLSKNPEKDNKFNESENDLTINFDRIFDNVIKKKDGIEATPKPQIEPSKIAEQITPRLLEMASSVEKKDEKEILRLRLHPAELGTVEITLERDSSGVLNAHFKTETEGAREVLSNGLEMLRESLQKAGWEIGQMDITNGSNSSADNQNRQNNQQKSEWIENFIFNRSAEQPDEPENNSPTRLLNLLA